MAVYAQMYKGAVANVIVADADFAALFPAGTLIDLTVISPQPGIGWTFDGTTWTAALPMAPPPPFDPLCVEDTSP